MKSVVHETCVIVVSAASTVNMKPNWYILGEASAEICMSIDMTAVPLSVPMFLKNRIGKYSLVGMRIHEYGPAVIVMLVMVISLAPVQFIIRSK